MGDLICLKNQNYNFLYLLSKGNNLFFKANPRAGLEFAMPYVKTAWNILSAVGVGNLHFID